MITEIAPLTIKDGQETAFEAAFARAQQYISASNGYLFHELLRSIEEPNRYLLLVGWESVSAHVDGFRGSELHDEWKTQMHAFYDPSPEVGHFQHVTGTPHAL